MEDIIGEQREVEEFLTMIHKMGTKTIMKVMQEKARAKPATEKKERIPGHDYAKWEQYDAESALEEVEFEELRQKEEANKMKQKGNECLKSGSYAEAIEFYDKAIKLDKKNAVFHMNKAAAHLKMEKYEEATQDCTQALSIQPGNAKALYRRAVAYISLGKFIEATADLEQANANAPGDKLVENELKRMQRLTRRRKIPVVQINSEKLLTEIKRNAQQAPKIIHKCFSPPKTCAEFLRDWKQLQSDEKALYDYLKLIQPKEFPQLFKSSLEPVHFKSIFSVIKNHSLAKDSKEAIVFFIQCLTKTERFDMNLMFITKQSKADLTHIFTELRKNASAQLKKQINELANKFQLK